MIFFFLISPAIAFHRAEDCILRRLLFKLPDRYKVYKINNHFPSSVSLFYRCDIQRPGGRIDKIVNVSLKCNQ